MLKCPMILSRRGRIEIGQMDGYLLMYNCVCDVAARLKVDSVFWSFEEQVPFYKETNGHLIASSRCIMLAASPLSDGFNKDKMFFTEHTHSTPSAHVEFYFIALNQNKSNVIILNTESLSKYIHTILHLVYI